jgi:hypothetical protein
VSIAIDWPLISIRRKETMRVQFSAAVLITFIAGCSAQIHAGDKPEGKTETTEGRLERYGKELVEAWEKFPAEHQKNVRTQTLTDINSVFTREAPRTEPAKDKKLAQIFNSYLANIDRATDLFKVEKMKTERSSYVKGCSIVFKREWVFATDYAAERTTQKCYELLLDWLEQARDKFVMDKDKDLRQEALQSINQLFTDLIRTAKVPDNIDHAMQMDKNIKDAKMRFPMTTETMKAKNSPVFQLCEQAAKTLKQRALQKQN